MDSKINNKHARLQEEQTLTNKQQKPNKRNYKNNKAMITVAAAAALGLIQNVNCVQAAYGSTHNELSNKMKESPDSIASSSTDDMFAFSQIIAAGQNPMATANAMEKELTKPKPTDPSQLNDDQSVLAFSQFIAGGGGVLRDDPAAMEAAKKKKSDEKKAASELEALQTNDSTSAFAALAESQTIESKAEAFKGSAPEEPDEDALLAEKVKEKKKKDAQQKVVDGIMKKKMAELKKKKMLAAAKARVPKKSKLSDAIQMLKAGKTLQEVRIIQDSMNEDKEKDKNKKVEKPKFSRAISSLKSHEEPTPASAPIVTADVELPPPSIKQEVQIEQDTSIPNKMDEASADAQADDIIKQIKAATAGGDNDAQIQALEELSKAQLVQLDNDPDADVALEYLTGQFPSDFDNQTDIDIKNKSKVISEEEKIQLHKKEGIELSKKALQKAEQLSQDIQEEMQKKSDSKKTTFEIADMVENKKQNKVNLAQVKSKQKNDPDADLALEILAEQFPEEYPNPVVKDKVKELSTQERSQLENQEAIKLSQKALAKAQAYTDTKDKESILKAESKMSTYQMAGMDDTAKEQEKRELAARKSDAKKNNNTLFLAQTLNKGKLNSNLLLDSLNTLGLSTSQMSYIEQNLDGHSRVNLDELTTDQMKSYSESVAQAADVVNNESEEAVKGASATQKTTAKNSKAEEELEAKAAIVAQAEAANSAAIGGLAQADASQAKDKTEEQKNQQYQADIKSALDQGYTQIQADQYAKQEQFAGTTGSTAPAKVSADPKPALGPAITPPTQIGESAGGAMKATTDSEQMSLQQQIQKAQEEQESIKAAIKQKKLQKQAVDEGKDLATTDTTSTKSAVSAQVDHESIIKNSSATNLQSEQQVIVGEAATTTATGEAVSVTSQAQQRRLNLEKQAEEQANKEAQEIYEKQQQDQGKSSTKIDDSPATVTPTAILAAAPVAIVQAPIAAAETTSLIQKAPITTKTKEQLVQAALKSIKAKKALKLTAAAKAKALEETVPAQVPEPVINLIEAAPIVQPVALVQAPVALVQAPAALVQEQIPNPEPIAPIVVSQTASVATTTVTVVPEPVAPVQSLAQDEPQAAVQKPVVVAKHKSLAKTAIKASPALNESKKVISLKPVQKIAIASAPKTAAAKPVMANKALTQKQILLEKQVQQNKLVEQVKKSMAATTKSIDQTLNAKDIETIQVKKSEKTHVTEKQTIQQSADIKQEDFEVSDQTKDSEKEVKETKKQDDDTSDAKDEDKKLQHRIFLDKKRAEEYEKDLNKARDEIQVAQLEMKNIDSEVGNFHQKMAKSMHSLLKAFTEGFDAMDKAKTDEVNELTIQNEERQKKRVKKLDKIHSSISNLEQLTSKLKLSFNDEKNLNDKNEINLNIQQEIHTKTPVDLEQKVAKEATVPAPVETDQNPVSALVQQASKSIVQQKLTPKHLTLQKVNPVSKPLTTVAVQVKTTQKPISALKKVTVKPVVAPVLKKTIAKPASKMVTPLKKINLVKLNQVSTATTKKMTNPALANAKAVALKKLAATAKLNAFKSKSAANLKASLKAKMQALLTSSAKKNKLAQKPLNLSSITPSLKSPSVSEGPLSLAQVGTHTSNLQKNLFALSQMTDNLDQFKKTQENLKKMSQSLAQTSARTDEIQTVANSLGITMDEEMKKEAAKDGSNKMIAHVMADRVVEQIKAGKMSKEDISKDMKNMKKSLVLAQKAFYEKDPEAIELLELDSDLIQKEQSNSSSDERIILYSNNENKKEDVNDDNVQLQISEESELKTSPEQNEEEIAALD